MENSPGTAPMTNYWLIGFIGTIMIVVAFVGFFLFCISGCLSGLTGDKTTPMLFLLGSIGLGAWGSYLRYLSRQATFDPTNKLGQTTVAVSVNSPIEQSNSSPSISSAHAERYAGGLDLNDDAYKIYLVKKYEITKNDVLGGFIIGDRIVATVDAALKVADEKYRADI